MKRLTGPAVLAGLFALAGCVGAPAPGPVGYAPPPGYAPGPGPGYGPGPGPGYAPGPGGPGPGYAGQPGYGGGGPTQVAYGQRCYAGVYTCDLPQALPVGAACSCPGLGAPSYGNVR